MSTELFSIESMGVALLIFWMSFHPPLFASAWDECRYQLNVTKTSASRMHFDQVKFLSGEGMAGSPGKFNCLSYVKDKVVDMNNVVEGKELLHVGHRVTVVRRSYSAMGPAGPVSGVTFKIRKIKSVGKSPNKQ